MSHVPDWWTLTLLVLAVFRVWRLLAEDDVLDRPRAWLLRLGDWKEGDPVVPSTYRAGLGKFLSCPWCLGFWLSLGWWGAWMLWPHASAMLAAPWALSAVVGLVGSRLND